MNTLSKVGNGLKLAAYVVVGVPLFLVSWGLGAAHSAVSRVLWGPDGGP
jgi:hypothetical protein